MSTTRHLVIEEDLRRIVSFGLPWDRLYGKTILISGANGFVPSYMLETLLYLNESVGAGIHAVALVRNKEGARRRLGHLAGRPDLTIVVHSSGTPLEINRYDAKNTAAKK